MERARFNVETANLSTRLQIAFHTDEKAVGQPNCQMQ
jgi:hypothetical protein